jgi:hypothetical protein
VPRAAIQPGLDVQVCLPRTIPTTHLAISGFSLHTPSDRMVKSAGSSQRCRRVRPRPRDCAPALEPPKELGDSLLAEMFCPAQRFRFLVLVIEIAAQGVMRIVGFTDEIADGELNLVDPRAAWLWFW